ncbi:MAG: hypothetical protein ACOYNL_03645 [Rickettsiales bacterium]
MPESRPIVLGRSCQTCAMCCKVLEIKALDKPRNQWCQHCSTHQKCDIYLERPDTCHNFNCGYLTEDWMGEHWHPLRSRMLVNFSADGKHMFVHVDPARPDAWRNSPYIENLRGWARGGNQTGSQVIVAIAQRFIVIFPDREQDLGTVSDDETVTFTITQTIIGPRTEAQKVKIAP